MPKLPSMNPLPADKITKYTKPQVDQYVRANKEYMKGVGLVGCISLIGAIVYMVTEIIKNNHEEKMAEMEHEVKMAELEIEKLKLEKED